MVRKLFFFVCAVMYIVSAVTANAAPLPGGTVLKITPGVGSGLNTPCIVGSCIGWESTPGFYFWRDILPGTDGGFIIGKSQASGGQEIDRSLTTPGQLTAAGELSAFGRPDATLYTLPNGGTANMFDDANCTQAACIGKTALNVLNMAWNGNGDSIPMGSAAGCNHPNCTADQRAGIFIKNYVIDLVGNNWAMDYAQVLPTGGLQGLKARIIFRGSVVPVPQPNCPVVDYAWRSPNSRMMLVFGSQLTGVTGVVIDGVNAPFFQEVNGRVLLVIFPPGVTVPWKPGTVQVTANGCSGSFPRPCGT